MNHRAYEQLLERSEQRSIFAEPWWLDIAAGGAGRWEPNLVAGPSGAAVAAWPLVERSTRRGIVGTGAPYTPFLGPILAAETPQAGARGWTRVVDQLEQAASAVRDHAHVEAAASPHLVYWTPLSWHGYEQTTRTTWRIAEPVDVEAVVAGMRKGARSALRGARDAAATCAPGSIGDLVDACRATFGRQGGGVPGEGVLADLAAAALAGGRGEVLAVRTATGALAAAGLFVHDDRWTYNLAQGRIDAEGSAGAPTLLMVSAIEHAAVRGTGFDFEGSMLPAVERYVRGFGGAPDPYSVVRRSSPAHARSVAVRRLGRRALRRGRTSSG